MLACTRAMDIGDKEHGGTRGGCVSAPVTAPRAPGCGVPILCPPILCPRFAGILYLFHCLPGHMLSVWICLRNLWMHNIACGQALTYT